MGSVVKVLAFEVLARSLLLPPSSSYATLPPLLPPQSQRGALILKGLLRSLFGRSPSDGPGRHDDPGGVAGAASALSFGSLRVRTKKDSR